MLIKIYLICIISMLYCEYTMSQCDSNDWAALKSFYQSTDGNNWIDNSNWIMVSGAIPPQNCNLGDMSGIILNKENRVSGIELPENNLNGTIPSEIAQLSKLDEVVLSGNNLSGSLPPEIGQLKNLVVLEIDNNNVSGALPPSIGTLSELESLILNDNDLSGTIPPEYGNLGSLSDLYLSGNQLSGCFDENLSTICEQLYYYDNITAGNNFDAAWTDFCTTSAGQCSSCVGDLTLSANTNSNQTYQASQSITSTATISAQVTYNAGDFILLEKGFCTLAMFDFDVKIEGCN